MTRPGATATWPTWPGSAASSACLTRRAARPSSPTGSPRYRPELAATAQAREAARFLLVNPPLPAVARAPYGMLAAAAVSLLPGWARRPLRLPRLPVTETVLVRPAGHAMVRAIRWATSAPPPVPL